MNITLQGILLAIGVMMLVYFLTKYQNEQRTRKFSPLAECFGGIYEPVEAMITIPYRGCDLVV